MCEDALPGTLGNFLIKKHDWFVFRSQIYHFSEINGP